MSSEINSPMFGPITNNQKEASKSGTDTISTLQLLSVANQEPVSISIPITEPPVANPIDNRGLVGGQDTIPILDIIPIGVDNKHRAIELNIAKFPTIKLPVGVRRSKSKRDKRKELHMLLVGAVVTVLFCVIGGTYVLASENLLRTQRPQDSSSYAISQLRKLKPERTMPTATQDASTEDAQEVTALGQQYMNALLSQQYNIMWLLLHPQVQAMWPNETSFSNYWQVRFRGFTLQNFTLGQAHSLSFWVNPETMMRYNQVEALPISLQLSAQVSANQLSQLPTLDQNPSQLFQNLPLIAQRTTLQTGREMSEQWLILSGGPADLEAPILPPIMPVRRTINIPILMYHHITNVPTHNILDFSLTVNPIVFSRQLDYLKQRGYHTITFNQLFDFLYYNGPLPSKPIILTFDDGYDDAYNFAYPILQAHGYSGMFFIITGKVGWKGQATWDQLREMLANGMQMGSHTVHHVNIGLIWRVSHTVAQQELQQAKQDLQAQLDIVIQQFCYPTGEPFHHEKPVVQQAVMALLAQDGYIGATTDPPPVGITQDSQKPFILLRVRVDGRESLQAFYASIP